METHEAWIRTIAQSAKPTFWLFASKRKKEIWYQKLKDRQLLHPLFSFFTVTELAYHCLPNKKICPHSALRLKVKQLLIDAGFANYQSGFVRHFLDAWNQQARFGATLTEAAHPILESIKSWQQERELLARNDILQRAKDGKLAASFQLVLVEQPASDDLEDQFLQALITQATKVQKIEPNQALSIEGCCNLCTTPQEEVEAVAAQIGKLALMNVPLHQMKISVSDRSAYAPILTKVFQYLKIPFYWAHSSSLLDWPWFRWFLQELEYPEHGRSLNGLLQIDSEKAVIFQEQIQQIRQKRSPLVLAQGIQSLLKQLWENERIDLRQQTSVLQLLEHVAGEFQTIQEDQVDIADFLQVMKDEAALTIVPAPHYQGIEIVDDTEMSELEAPFLFWLGAHRTRWTSNKQNFFIEKPGSQSRWEHQQMRKALGTVEGLPTVYLTVSAEKGEVNLPTFLLNLALNRYCSEQGLVTRDKQQLPEKGAFPPSYAWVDEVVQQWEDKQPFYTAAKWPHFLERTFSYSSLSLLQQCPFHYLLESYALQVPEDRCEFQLPPQQKGILIHRIVEKLSRDQYLYRLQSQRNASDLLLRTEIELWLRQIIREMFPNSVNIYWQRELNAFFLGLEDAHQQGIFPAFLQKEKSLGYYYQKQIVEKKFTATMLTLLGNVPISGIIDRIDFISDTQAIVYDYKTGVVPQPKDIQAGRVLQFPLYFWGLRQEFPQLEEIACIYYRMNTNRKEVELANFCYGNWKEPLKSWSKTIHVEDGFSEESTEQKSLEEIVTDILQSALSGHFPPQVFAWQNGKLACEYCPYQWVCRVEEWQMIREKQNVVSS